MTYFKSLSGSAIDAFKSQLQTTAPKNSGIATPESIAFAKTKQNWPRCTVTIRDERTNPPTVSREQGYLYKFKDGSQRCTRGWDQAAYRMVVLGETPPIAVPDLSSVVRGTPEYFKWLCKAQGSHPRDKGVQQVRMAFDQMGWEWAPTTDSKGRRWNGYGSAPKPMIAANNIGACARYMSALKNAGAHNKDHAGANSNWRYEVYQFSLNQGSGGREKAEDAKEHRPDACDDPKYNIPPELREACKAAMRKNDGTSIESFKKQIEDMSAGELEQFIVSGPSGGASLPPPPGGIPPMYLYAGATAAVGLVALLAIGKKK